ncbi:MAG: N-acetyltransferase family protein [Verrucomicrobiota bacterium]|nr:N-acetyltransferase family protein [Verrucomicrobiota bacterium]
MNAAHWPDVRRIYEEGIATGNATFAASAPEVWEDWERDHLLGIVARVDDEVCGWAGVAPISNRCMYAGVAEVSLYVAEKCRGIGIGIGLLKELIARSEAQQIWTLQAGIFPENIGSIRLHEKCGFKVIGRRERLGKMTFGPFVGKWRDVVLLERRSEVAGVD